MEVCITEIQTLKHVVDVRRYRPALGGRSMVIENFVLIGRVS